MTTDPRILILEDVVNDAELVQRELRKANITFTAKCVKQKDAFLEALRDFMPDIILSDYSLPQFNALGALALMKEQALEIPFILVTGSLTEEVAVSCMKEGAYDYILKSSLKRLPSAVLNALAKRDAERERERAIESLRKSEERFRLVARATNDAVWDVDLVANKVWRSEVFQTMFGYPPEEIGDDLHSWSERLHPDDLQPVRRSILDVIHNGGQTWLGEYRFRRADDAYAYIVDRGYVVRNDKGEPVRMLGSMMDVTARKAAEERINYLAYYDALTGMPNRTLFENRLPQALSLAERNEQMVAVMLFELDRFDGINDTLGHATGDRLLQGVAQRLVTFVRGSDTVARFSANGFALMSMQIRQSEDAAKIAERTQQTIEIATDLIEALRPPFNFDGQELYVTARIGIGLYPYDGTDAQTLLKNAAAALQRARQEDGPSYQFYTADMNAKALKRLTLETNLRRALERDEFLLYYQPQVDIATGQMCGLEALVRWQHPKSGLVSPAEFIPLAEETGLIVPLGERVLRKACAQHKSWQQDGIQPRCVSVNLSALQFRQPNLAEVIARVLRDTALDPTYLELELTESSVMKDPERAIQTLCELRDMGIHVAIDDFGAGYSSLSYLKRFPIDRLKIDQSFVREATTDPADAAIIMAIITLAHNLRLKVIAEGVETEEQLRFLRLLRCDEVQGYLFSRPLPAEEIRRLLREGWPAPLKENLLPEARRA
jgi:diguanylate cyclase (GGDEF)-like protein/PAS domain S-box-containing protein